MFVSRVFEQRGCKLFTKLRSLFSDSKRTEAKIFENKFERTKINFTLGYKIDYKNRENYNRNIGNDNVNSNGYDFLFAWHKLQIPPGTLLTTLSIMFQDTASNDWLTVTRELKVK